MVRSASSADSSTDRTPRAGDSQGSAAGAEEEKEPEAEEASLLPEDLLGDLSKWVATAARNDPHPLTHKAISEMTGYHEICNSLSGGHVLFTRAISINEGPFAFLTVSPTIAGSDPVVEVVHCTKEYVLPIGRVAAPTDDAANRTIVFVGETQLGQLPKLYMEPSTGLDELAIESECLMPSDDQVAAFYASRDTADIKSHELLPRRTGVAIARTAMAKWMFIPSYFIPSFIGGLSPREAWEKATKIIQKIPAPSCHYFDRITLWARAACIQRGGGGIDWTWSQMAVRWRIPRRSAGLTN
jgi:hypothetical protein